MNRAEKEAFVAEIRARFESAPLVILTDFQGSTVNETDELRRACEPAGVRFQVVKNTLCRRDLEGTDKESLAKFFRGNIGVIFSDEDPIAAAKLFKEQATLLKKHGAAVVVMAFDEEGQAATEAEKVRHY